MDNAGQDAGNDKGGSIWIGLAAALLFVATATFLVTYSGEDEAADQTAASADMSAPAEPAG